MFSGAYLETSQRCQTRKGKPDRAAAKQDGMTFVRHSCGIASPSRHSVFLLTEMQLNEMNTADTAQRESIPRHETHIAALCLHGFSSWEVTFRMSGSCLHLQFMG